MGKIKVKINENLIKEYNVEDMYFRKIKFVEPEFYTQIMVTYCIGEFKGEKIYGDLEEYQIDEVIVCNILRDFPNIKIIEEIKINYE